MLSVCGEWHGRNHGKDRCRRVGIYSEQKPAQRHGRREIFREQDRVFNDFNKIPIGFQAAMNEKDPVSVESFKDEKAYKIIIDLKPFDNNINNVDVKIDGRKVTVSGIKFKDRHNREDLYTFSQTFLLPQEVDSLAVTKEKVKDKYVITQPILEEDD